MRILDVLVFVTIGILLMFLGRGDAEGFNRTTSDEYRTRKEKKIWEESDGYLDESGIGNWPYFGYENVKPVKDCFRGCCDVSSCEVTGRCQWLSPSGKLYTGTPDQCVNYRLCIGENVQDDEKCARKLELD